MIIPSIYRQKINIIAEFFLKIGQKIFVTLVPLSPPTFHQRSGQQTTTHGLPLLTLNADGRLQCDACLICQNICPTNCIKILGKNQQVINFEINMLKCIYCNLCEQHCPIDAIRFTAEYSRDITNSHMNLESLAYRSTLNQGTGVKTAIPRTSATDQPIGGLSESVSD